MSIDPIQLITASRPGLGDVPTAGEGVVVSGGQHRRTTKLEGFGDLDDLSATPGSPGYQAKMAGIQKQVRLKGDPEDIRAMQEPSALILPESVQPAPVAQQVSPTKRVAIYYGKNDTYNIAVESAPDWDTDLMFKGKTEAEVGLLIDLAKALDVRCSDKTGDF